MNGPLVWRFQEVTDPHGEVREAMVPLTHFARDARQRYSLNQTYALDEVQTRSEVSHRHEFAWLREAWGTLPDDLAAKYPNEEVLRKQALIATGWCTINDHPCNSHAEAERTAVMARGLVDEYAVVLVEGSVVRIIRPKSQARGHMNAADFKASKSAILDWVSALIGVEPAALEHASAA